MSKTRNHLNKVAADRLSSTVGYYLTTVVDKVEPMDKQTGQIIVPCEVEGCNAELEVYPDPYTPNIYDATGDSLKTARYLCNLEKGSS